MKITKKANHSIQNLDVTAFEILLNFYVLQEIKANILKEKDEDFLPSHVKFRKDFYSFYTNYCQKTKEVFKDYLIFACISETIHAPEECECTFYSVLGGSTYFVTDDHIYKNLYKLNVQDFVNMAYDLFCNYDWNEWYGGKAWGTATEYITLAEKLPNEIFIDACADLQHNSGSIFDKSGPLSENFVQRIHELLNFKFNAESFIEELKLLINQYEYKFLFSETYNLLIRYSYLYLKDKDMAKKFTEIYLHLYNSHAYIRSSHEEFLKYQPIEYTNESMVGEIVDSEKYRTIFNIDY